jgi:hypothetical protein
MGGPINGSNGRITQPQGSPNTTLETRTSEAPWIRDQRQKPRSVRNSLTSTPPSGRKRQVPSISTSNHFEESRRRGKSNNKNRNPFDSPDVFHMQQHNNLNPFDSPSITIQEDAMTTNTTLGAPNSHNNNDDGDNNSRRTNPFESPSPARVRIEKAPRQNRQPPTESTNNNPFDSPAVSTRPPVSPNRKSYQPSPVASVLSPAKQESVALDSLEQILDTTDETTLEEDEEIEILTDRALQQRQNQNVPHNTYPFPSYQVDSIHQGPPQGLAVSPSPFRTPPPSGGPLTIASPWSRHSPSKQSHSTPPTTSSRSMGSWGGDATSQDTTPSDRALRAAETLRRNFEHRRRKQGGGKGNNDDDGRTLPPGEWTTLDELIFEYSKTEGSDSTGKKNTASPSSSSLGADGFPEEKKQEVEKSPETPVSDEMPPSNVDSTNFVLHDLCDEARSTDDVAWRNALFLLSVQPQLATQQEPEAHMTPLHVACLATDPPPLWMTRGLLYTAPSTCRQTDNGGRLPLHLLVATSADVDTIRLLVEEYPPSVAHKDDRGFTPLHLLLKNDQISLTLEHLRLVLGQTTYGNGSEANRVKRSSMLFRKGDHLKKSIEELEELSTEREQTHELTFRQYPDDVRQSLNKLSQWKRRQDHKQAHIDKRLHQENLAFMHAKEKEFDNPGSMATLHLLVRRNVNTEPSRDIYSSKEATQIDLLRVLVAAYPNALVQTDAHGKTPLMTAMLQPYSLPSGEVVELLLGLRTPGFTFWNLERPALIPSGQTGQLPLHVAAEEFLSDYSLVGSVCEAYPDARMVQDFRGRTPLHLALRNYRSVPVDEATMEMLYIDSIANVKDDDGKKPFDLLVENPNCVQEPTNQSIGVRRNSKVFQDFLDASIERPRNGREAQQFLLQLRNLPPWLRRQACAATSVQDTLLEEIASPLTTFRIFGSGLVLVLLLTLLRRLLHANSDLGVLVYYFAAYHLTIQLIHWGTTLYMGECWRLCVSNPWRWVDWATSILSILCAHAVGSGLLENANQEVYLSKLGALATASCWLSLLGYMVDWWHGVAVFVGSAVEVLSVLVWPLWVAAMGIIATSQVLYTLEDCTEEGVCSISRAYTVVYHIMLGEPVVSVDYQISRSLSIIVVVFTMLVIWWIFSALAMIVVEANRLDRQQVAVMWYWEPKILLTAMTIGRLSGKQRDTPTLTERWCNTMEAFWNVLLSAICGKESIQTWDMCCLRSKASTVMTGFLTFFLVPLWLALGLATLGLFWPPQVRRWVFSSAGATGKFRGRHCVMSTENELTRAKLTELRSDVVELKSIAYDQHHQIQKDLGFLKDVILRAAMEDDDHRHPKFE